MALKNKMLSFYLEKIYVNGGGVCVAEIFQKLRLSHRGCVLVPWSPQGSRT
jgi:hypothetical protein